MAAQMHEDVEAGVVFSRRSLWFALAVVALLGVAAVATLAGHNGMGTRLFYLLPVVIVIGAAGLGRSAGRAQMRLLASDELRQFSLGRAYRNGFFAALAAQPLLAWGAPTPAVMAAATVTLAVLAALASVLWFDR